MALRMAAVTEAAAVETCTRLEDQAAMARAAEAVRLGARVAPAVRVAQAA